VRTVEKDQKKIVPDVPDSSMGYVEIMEFATGFIRTREDGGATRNFKC
jgi:hypothetical protein